METARRGPTGRITLAVVGVVLVAIIAVAGVVGVGAFASTTTGTRSRPRLSVEHAYRSCKHYVDDHGGGVPAFGTDEHSRPTDGDGTSWYVFQLRGQLCRAQLGADDSVKLDVLNF